MPQTPLEAIDGVPNACQLLPTLVTGGQPTPAHLQGLKGAGISLVIDLRDPMEPRPLDEPALLRDLGIEYLNVPVSTGSLSDTTLEQILTALRSAGDRQVFLHCASGNRVGGALIAYFMIDKGLSEEDATAQAMRAGLRSAEMMEWGLDYAKRHPGKGA